MLFYILIGVIFVVSKIYQGIKKAREEQAQRQRENAQRAPTSYSAEPEQQRRPQPTTIPDPWQQPKPAPAAQRKVDTSRPKPVTRTQPAPRQKSIEEVLEDMMRQYDTPKANTPRLDDPYSKLDSPYSAIEKHRPEAGRNYKFDESLATSALSAESYINILEEDDTLDDRGPKHLYEFNPREAFKYSILLERKYQ